MMVNLSLFQDLGNFWLQQQYQGSQFGERVFNRLNYMIRKLYRKILNEFKA